MKVLNFSSNREVSFRRQCRETKGEFFFGSVISALLIVLSYFVAQRKQQICSLTPLFL